MEHSFDTDIAQEYGIQCAILLRHLYFWIEKNKANERHYYDDYYWTYSSIKALTELFPYMSKNTIVRSIQKLVDDGLLIEGNYNNSSYDRTKWYALTNLGYSICEKSEIHLPKFRNGNTQSQKPIPDILTDTITDNNKNISKEIFIPTKPESSSGITDEIQKVVEEWNTLSVYGVKPIRSLKPDTNKYKMLKARLSQYGYDSVIEAINNVRSSDFLQGKTGKNPFCLDFEWFVRPNNFDKVLNGKYNHSNALLPTGTDNNAPIPDYLKGFE